MCMYQWPIKRYQNFQQDIQQPCNAFLTDQTVLLQNNRLHVYLFKVQEKGTKATENDTDYELWQFALAMD